MPHKWRMRSVPLVVIALITGLGWMFLWQALATFAWQLRPLPALAGIGFVVAACVFSLRLGSSRQRRRRAATLGLRALGPGLPCVGLAIVAMHANTLLLAALAWQLFGDTGPTPADYPYASQPLGALVWPLSSILVAPLAEEIGLRGYAQGRIARRLGPMVAVTLSAAVFALLHGSRAWLPYFFIGGVLFGWARVATRSIWTPVLMHGASNALVVPATLSFGSLLEWCANLDAALLLLGVAVSFAATVAALGRAGARMRTAHLKRLRPLSLGVTVP